MSTETTTSYFLSDEYSSHSIALVVEHATPGGGYYRHTVAFKADLDKMHPALWPTLLVQYGLSESASPEHLAIADRMDGFVAELRQANNESEYDYGYRCAYERIANWLRDEYQPGGAP